MPVFEAFRPFEKAKYAIENHLYSYLHHFVLNYGPGVLPSSIELSGVERVLDVACGNGEWICEVARQYPEVEVYGLESNSSRVEYARAVARVRGLSNVEIIAGDMHAMRLPAEHFDLVHGRWLALDVPLGAWYYLLKDVVRLLRPGGRIIWQEASFPTTNSSACVRWCRLLQEAVEALTYLPGVLDHMEEMLREAGCTSTQHITTSIALSSGTAAYKYLQTSAWPTLLFTQPLLTEAGVIDASQFDALQEAVVGDICSERFSGTWPLITGVGVK